MHAISATFLFILFAVSIFANDHVPLNVFSRAQEACISITKAVSSQSQVFFPGSLSYYSDITHYMTSSTENSACSVEVGSTTDTATVMQIISSRRIPFAVKSGGHASNPGFSSTPGVMISLVRLKTVEVSADRKTALIGMGNIWTTDVYPTLDKLGYNVAGGRVTGPGVGGFTLGGGYSWLTNQYGLTCDSALFFTLVMPNGTVQEIGPKQTDLSFALKGGLNRFGIVTHIRYAIYPQVPQVYGGYTLYTNDSVPALLKAAALFSATNTDPKAQVILTLNSALGIPGAVLLTFYDGPLSPSFFDTFESIPKFFADVKRRSFSDFAKATPSEATKGARGAFNSLSTAAITQGYLEAVYNQTLFYSNLAASHSGVFISYDIEPFSKQYGEKATDSAYPHANSPLPLNLYFSWSLEEEDEYWRDQMMQSVKFLTEVAKKEGIYSPDIYTYPNYALAFYKGDQLYGPTNAKRLRRIRDEVDPERIMDLTGGFVL